MGCFRKKSNWEGGFLRKRCSLILQMAMVIIWAQIPYSIHLAQPQFRLFFFTSTPTATPTTTPTTTLQQDNNWNPNLADNVEQFPTLPDPTTPPSTLNKIMDRFSLDYNSIIDESIYQTQKLLNDSNVFCSTKLNLTLNVTSQKKRDEDDSDDVDLEGDIQEYQFQDEDDQEITLKLINLNFNTFRKYWIYSIISRLIFPLIYISFASSLKEIVKTHNNTKADFIFEMVMIVSLLLASITGIFLRCRCIRILDGMEIMMNILYGYVLWHSLILFFGYLAMALIPNLSPTPKSTPKDPKNNDIEAAPKPKENTNKLYPTIPK